jgi:hypothetical protein
VVLARADGHGAAGGGKYLWESVLLAPRKRPIFAGVVMFVLAGPFPPFQQVYPKNAGRAEFAGYAPIFMPPRPRTYSLEPPDLRRPHTSCARCTHMTFNQHPAWTSAGF